MTVLFIAAISPRQCKAQEGALVWLLSLPRQHGAWLCTDALLALLLALLAPVRDTAGDLPTSGDDIGPIWFAKLQRVDTADAPRVDRSPAIVTSGRRIGASLSPLSVHDESFSLPAVRLAPTPPPALGGDTIQHLEPMIGSYHGTDAAG
ncbi:hypothetical protein N7539_007931 [Penicillium diatomitis]|uniref:Uncharacterized protein n=1 Tax=Penicillium diatomitis TaxID=2819901 RepID=A0A9W9WUA3_9EURO|nr:uncharacterized protein N7539_007931 [Penicillium diatomitis]KAJ5475644.1 hypothetical protein N7539_007931 [Penicillium diatomitis]